jgi:hypothetical protein
VCAASLKWGAHIAPSDRAGSCSPGGDIAPLEVVDTVELGMLQALAELGPAACATCCRKEGAVSYRYSVRDSVLRECGFWPGRAARISELLDVAFAMALDALRPADLA